MHYGATGFTRNGLDSMETVPVGIPIGQRTVLSAGDIDGISRTYGFTPTPPPSPACLRDCRSPSMASASLTPQGLRLGARQHPHGTRVTPSAGAADPRYIFVRWSDSPDHQPHHYRRSRQTVFWRSTRRNTASPTTWAAGSRHGHRLPRARGGYFPTACPCASPPLPPTAAVRPLGRDHQPDRVEQQRLQCRRHRAGRALPIHNISARSPLSRLPPQIQSAGTHRHRRWHVLPDARQLRVGAGQHAYDELTTASQTFGNNTVHYEFTGWEDGGHRGWPHCDPPAAPRRSPRISPPNICSPPQTSGAGRITVSPSSSDGYYDAGTQGEITAIPNAGFALRYWLGDFAGGTLEQTVTMDDQHYAVAVFGTPLPFTVLNAASFLGNPQFDATGFRWSHPARSSPSSAPISDPPR